MKTTNLLTSACRFCRYYQPEGRRGGNCEMLNAPVQSHWKACSFATPPFSSTWESLQDIMLLENSFSRSSKEDSNTETANSKETTTV